MSPEDHTCSAALPRAKPAVALAGVGASAAQVVLIRELLVASAGNELSIAAVLSSWLLWSALGVWLGGRVIGRSRRSAILHVSLPALLAGPVFALALAASRGALLVLRETLGGALLRAHVVPPPGGTLSLPQLLLLATVVAAPAGVLLGWQFAAGCRLLEVAGGGGRTGSSLAYVLDSLGHLAGGAVLSVAAVTRVAPEWLLLAGWLLALLGLGYLQPRLAPALVAAALVGGPCLRLAGAHTLPLRWAPFQLADSRNGPLGNVSVLSGAGGELSFFENGAHAFETGKALAGEQWVHLPLLAHASPERVLLIGGGPRVLREVLRHRPREVRYFELDPTLLEAVRRHAPEDLRRVLDDPAVKLSVGDARLHLGSMRRGGEAFDAVLVALSDPSTAQLNRYYTLEWFRGVRSVLAPGGSISFQVMSSGDYLSPELRSYDACLFHTARRAGLSVGVFPGLHMVLVCSPGTPTPAPIFDDLPALEARIHARGLDPDTLLASFYDALDPSRRQDRQRDLELASGVQLNRDFSPRCYYYAQVLWASWWRGGAARLLRAAERLEPRVLVAGGVALTVLIAGVARRLRRPARLSATYAVLVAGAGGMTLEVVLLLGLQSLYGYVYGLVGYAVGVLMAGLAAGAWLAQRRVKPERAWVGLLWALFGLAVAAKASDASLQLLQRLGEAQALPGVVPILVVSVLMVGTGLAVGATFPAGLAALAEGEGVLRRATALYAADLVGASGGAIVGGLILIPLFGVGMTCALVALLAVSALVGVVAGGTRGTAA